VLANALSHLCRLIHKFSLATHHSPLPAPLLPSPANLKFLRYIKAWILPLDSLVDNHFCTIENSISPFVLDRSQQYCRHSGGYTVADIYTVADTQGRI